MTDYAAVSLALTAYACNGERGRLYLGDSVFETITEHRQAQTELIRKHQLATGVPSNKLAFYSACADLCHWHYWHCGVQMPWVNRDESKAVDGTGWVVEKNIALLSDISQNECVRECAVGDVYEPGDCVHIGTPGRNNDHVMIVRHHDARTGEIDVAEYGQPGGALHRHVIVVSRGVAFMGARQMRTFLRFSRVLEVADVVGSLAPLSAETLAIVAEWGRGDTIPSPPPVGP